MKISNFQYSLSFWNRSDRSYDWRHKSDLMGILIKLICLMTDLESSNSSPVKKKSRGRIHYVPEIFSELLMKIYMPYLKKKKNLPYLETKVTCHQSYASLTTTVYCYEITWRISNRSPKKLKNKALNLIIKKRFITSRS